MSQSGRGAILKREVRDGESKTESTYRCIDGLLSHPHSVRLPVLHPFVMECTILAEAMAVRKAVSFVAGIFSPVSD